MTSESKCPVAGGGEHEGKEGKYAKRSDAMRAFANSDWWPEQLNLKGLQHDSPLVDPMGEGFDYAKEVFAKFNRTKQKQYVLGFRLSGS